MPEKRLAIIPHADTVRDPLLPPIITDVAQLLEFLQLDPDLLPAAQKASALFSLKVPRSYVLRMRKADPADPLLLQVLAQGQELLAVPGYDQDPLAEDGASPAPGILHKYQGRVLLMASAVCAVHCRYCFRRHFPYEEQGAGSANLEQAFTWLRQHQEIEEVILSGGDPLVLSARRLKRLLAQLSDMSHLKRLRIHSRQPIVMPDSINDEMVSVLAAFPLPVTLVVHANHANELNDEVGQCLQSLKQAGVTLLNQSVMLCGINDDAQTLVDLSERLFELGVLPYYLHLLDPVAGAAHFDLAEDKALSVFKAIQARLPGYLVPRLVRERAGEPGKSLIGG